MAFLLPIARQLRSKLKPTSIPLTHTKICSIPTISSGFGATNLSKFGLLFEHNLSYRISVEEECEEEGRESKSELFQYIKEKGLDNPALGRPLDCLMRNTMRVKFEANVQHFGALPSLLGNTLTCLQLVLIDENRCIQEKICTCTPPSNADDPDVASRHMFRVATPCFLHDTERWVFSRSLVVNKYSGVIDEALKFTSHDPIGDLNVLRDLPYGTYKDVFYGRPHGPSQTEVNKLYHHLLTQAMKKFETEPEMPLGIRCTEIFMFIAGDYAVNDGGLNSREAVQKLLHELYTEEGVHKIHGCYVACGSSKMTSKNLAITKDVHLTA